MADGYWHGASAVSNTSYQDNVGTSFAAPQVSGALALLAVAAPILLSVWLQAFEAYLSDPFSVPP